MWYKGMNFWKATDLVIGDANIHWDPSGLPRLHLNHCIELSPHALIIFHTSTQYLVSPKVKSFLFRDNYEKRKLVQQEFCVRPC
jgi:hypothetical protein